MNAPEPDFRKTETGDTAPNIGKLFPVSYSHLEPEVGIFWLYDGTLFHLESEPISKAIHTSVSIDYGKGHFAVWHIMAEKGLLNNLPLYKRSEYDSIPRGRVVYLFEEEKYVIYHGNKFNRVIRQDILNRLHLPPEQTLELIDEHYNPLDPDYIF